MADRSTLFSHVFVERCFVGEPEMVFNARTHTDSLCMHYGDFADIVRPIVGSFGVPPFARRIRVPKYRVRRADPAQT